MLLVLSWHKQILSRGDFLCFTSTQRKKREIKTKMEKRVIVICSVVGFLGLLSAATGFGAEAKRIKGSQVELISPDECRYPRSPALGLGLIAVGALVVAHIIINIETGCMCCRRGPRPSISNWTLALICFAVSWFAFVVAFLLLLTGAALNDEHGQESMYFGNYYCYVVKPGVFAGGSALSLTSVIFGIIYYLTITLGKSTDTNNANSWGSAPVHNQGSGIAMGQPQFPQQVNQDPVFVHEDTYTRRQVP